MLFPLKCLEKSLTVKSVKNKSLSLFKSNTLKEIILVQILVRMWAKLNAKLDGQLWGVIVRKF